MISALHGARQFVHRHGAEHAQGRLRADVRHTEQQAEHAPVGLGREAKQVQRVLPDVGVDPELHLSVGVDPCSTERTDRGQYVVADPMHVQDYRAGCLVGFHSQSSIDPRQYAVWLSKANHTYPVALRSELFAVHFLTARQMGSGARRRGTGLVGVGTE